ncbi:tetratricopeptide repeat protein [Streptomyces sp.]|uniref:tetratricopeptide repeat protein n=1 Tax=Streptomyces sp. TaxID=1931 RepID=UPI002F425401
MPKPAPKPVPKRDVPSHPEQTRRSSPLPTRFEEDLLSALGSRDASRFREQLSIAESAFRRERYFDARRTLAPLMAELAGVASARELYGLTLYRLGKWRVAAAELEAYRTLSGSVEHLPVLADCYRALRRHAKVAELWTELKAASPSAAVVAEGRIVMAGSLADRGDLRGAIALLRPAGEMPRRLRDHHIRTWYVLADLYDRSGDATAARQLFGRIREVAPGFADAEDRLAALGR